MGDQLNRSRNINDNNDYTIGCAPGNIDMFALPDMPACRAAVALAMTSESTPIVNHSVRSYLFAKILYTAEGAAADVDLDLLFIACVLHDIGLSPAGDRDNRFEIDGADVASELLATFDVPPQDIAAVWDAIALHSSPGLAERRSPLCRYTRIGVLMDFGWNTEDVTDPQAQSIHFRYPRHGLAAVMADTVIGQTNSRPNKAPRYSLADVLVQERSGPTGLTRMERDEPHGRWATSAHPAMG